MKFNVVVATAAIATVMTVSAVLTDATNAEVEHLFARHQCCTYAKPGQWCGPQGCCEWRECTIFGGCGTISYCIQ
ncbi:hypothetical protein BGZ59_003387 [Podila verticillata]|nr:hypothetical protein BGZ59_003387 [Podila verticillata]KFH67314.1 hypothetical protein MVEG_06048 [Podila verticillata NRRL 6337]